MEKVFYLIAAIALGIVTLVILVGAARVIMMLIIDFADDLDYWKESRGRKNE